jgi:hypothetical protein
MVALLIPIIVIEGLLCKRWLGLSAWEALKANAASNVVSTIIGIPFAWFVMLAISFATRSVDQRIFESRSLIAKAVAFFLSSAWIGPVDNPRNSWIIAAATLALLVPFFLASYATEYFVIRFISERVGSEWENIPPKTLRLSVRNANLVTYGLMFMGTTIWLIVSLPKR